VVDNVRQRTAKTGKPHEPMVTVLAVERVPRERLSQYGVIAARDHLFFPHHLKGGKLKKHRVARVLLFGSREPNIWFDISGTLEKKIKALQSHESQVGRHENFPERIRAMTKNAGAAWDLPAAEAFRYLELG